MVHYKSSWYKLLFDNEPSYIDLLDKYDWKWDNCEQWEPLWQLWRDYHAEWMAFLLSRRRIRILYLCPRVAYETKMSRVRFDSIGAIGELAEVVWSGPGWSNFDENMTAHDNILSIYKNGYPDVVIAYKPLSVIDIHLVDALKVVMYNEMWDVDLTTKEICNSSLNLVVAHHKNDIVKYDHIKNVDIVHIGHCAEKKIYKNYHLVKNVDILVVGARNKDHYPFRERMVRLVEAHLAKKYKCEILDHPTCSHGEKKFVGESYAKKLNAAKLVLTCSSRWRYRLGKFIEIPMCGAVLAANLPNQDEEFFSDFMLVLDERLPDSQILLQICDILDNDHKRILLTEKGLSAVRDFTQEKYAGDFLAIIEKSLKEKIDFNVGASLFVDSNIEKSSLFRFFERLKKVLRRLMWN